MNKYKIINDYDANDSFEVEAATTEDAALEALERLGWWIANADDNEDEAEKVAHEE
jgi:hypothetical protein